MNVVILQTDVLYYMNRCATDFIQVEVVEGEMAVVAMMMNMQD
jgi:hypothetical protein